MKLKDRPLENKRLNQIDFKQKKESIILTLLILLFLFLGIYQIRLPGMFCDEGAPVVKAIEIIKNLERESFFSLFLKGKLPLMISEYHGALDVYLFLPFFYFLGINIIILRIVALIFSIFVIVITYFFMKEFFNKKAALISIFLLIINPTFIIGTRLGSWFGISAQLFSMGSLFLLFKCYHLKKSLYFYLAMFLLGLGLTQRLNFTWFVVGVFIIAFIFIKDIKNNFSLNKMDILKYSFIGGIIFCMGAFLILFYNFTSSFAAVKFLLSHFKESRFGVNNLNYLGSFLSVIKNFHSMLSAKYLFSEIFGRNIFNNLYPLTFWLSITILTFLAFLKKNQPEGKKFIFFPMLFFIMFFQTPVTPSTLPMQHFFYFYPLPQLIIGCAVYYLIKTFKKNKVILAGIAIFFAVFWMKELRSDLEFHYYLHKTGGVDGFSDAIYELADYLKEKPNINKIIICDWGFLHTFYFFLEEKKSVESSGYIEDITHVEPKRTILENEFIAKLKDEFNNKNNLYIFHSPEFTFRDCFELFSKIAKEMDRSIFEEKRFYQRDGRLVYLVYSVH